MRLTDIAKIEKFPHDKPTRVDVLDGDGQVIDQRVVLFDETTVVTDSRGNVHFVPNDPRNADYQLVKEWERQGGKVEVAALPGAKNVAPVEGVDVPE